MNVVVTITYNAMKHDILDGFFASMRAQADRDFVLVVIDNASTDGTRDDLRRRDEPWLRLILNDENIGFGRACNQGIAIARDLGARHVTFINNDVEFGPELLGGMVRSLEETGAAALSPLITPYDQPDHVWFITGRYRWERGIVPRHDWLWRPRAEAPADRIQRTDFATGCCLIFRMAVFDAIAGFDDRFFVYWEDADLSMEMQNRGMTIVTDTSLVCRHKVSASTGGQFSAFSLFHGTRGHMMFVRKHYGRAMLAYAAPVSAAKMVANILLGRMQARDAASWFRGLLSGLRD